MQLVELTRSPSRMVGFEYALKMMSQFQTCDTRWQCPLIVEKDGLSSIRAHASRLSPLKVPWLGLPVTPGGEMMVSLASRRDTRSHGIWKSRLPTHAPSLMLKSL